MLVSARCEVDKAPSLTSRSSPASTPPPVGILPLFGHPLLLVRTLRVLDGLDHLPTHLGGFVESRRKEVLIGATRTSQNTKREAKDVYEIIR